MKTTKLFATVLLMVLMAMGSYAATALFTSNIGGAQIQFYNDDINDWDAPMSFPVTQIVPQYTYILVKVTAAGHEEFERGYEVNRSGMNNFAIELTPIDPDPSAVPLFGVAGQIVSRRGLSIMDGSYRVVIRNLTSFKKTDAPQVSQDINYNQGDLGGFSCCLANFSTVRSPYGSAALVGDRLFVGVFNSTLTRCYGHKIYTLTEEVISDAGFFATIFIR